MKSYLNTVSVLKYRTDFEKIALVSQLFHAFLCLFLFIWLLWVLVAVHRFLDLCCSVWDL